ncbi:MAG: glycosyltransferase family 2 protein [Patescibacteria group bacterium]|nr:glycosyltransferase family 2 protein [Patescibacteria group bacterium]MDD5295050.1 glycosyltransferase family 2 protein [Patescibacteria group bacterium]MDD5554887.1 glycosyltransferase family 2 protein [Patescibacteria group bacterium]
MPALDEEKSIGQTIKNIPLDKLRETGCDIEILIVDGGSTDKTAEIAKNLGAKVIQSEKGYGRQYQLGFREARGDIIVTADSDNSYPMEEIPRLVKILESQNLDFISTNRFAKLDKGSMRPLNYLGNIVLTFFTDFLFGLNLKDSQSGMWVFRKSILDKINLTSNGMPLSQEIKIEAFKKLRAREVDSSYKKRVGEVKLRMFKDGWENLKHLFRKRIRS